MIDATINMRLFYRVFPIRDALRHELSWTCCRSLTRVADSIVSFTSVSAKT